MQLHGLAPATAGTTAWQRQIEETQADQHRTGEPGEQREAGPARILASATRSADPPDATSPRPYRRWAAARRSGSRSGAAVSIRPPAATAALGEPVRRSTPPTPANAGSASGPKPRSRTGRSSARSAPAPVGRPRSSTPFRGSVASVEGGVGQAVSMRRRSARVPAPRSGFAGFRFPPEVIVVAVRWYLRYGLSYRDVEELLAERGITVDHVTVYRWGAAVHSPARRRRPALPARARGSLVRQRDVRQSRRSMGLSVPGGRPVWAGH
jgi:hypothetical protein